MSSPRRTCQLHGLWLLVGCCWWGTLLAAEPGPTAPKLSEADPSLFGISLTDLDYSHWAFQPVSRPRLPDDVAGTPAIDRFLRGPLRERGLAHSPPASPRQWLRRVFLDLIGLPPSAEELAEFAADPSDFQRVRVVDRLLSHPGYGIRWGRRWLDVARFAETNGYERDGPKPHAWRYRDWVIDALNADLPLDRFIAEQVAGDQLPDRSAATMIATTFLRLGTWDDEPADPQVDRYDQLDDLVGTVSTAFLGLTLRCARCHNHKFEPLSQIDYARMLAVFEPLRRPQQGREDLDLPVGSEAEFQAHAAATARQTAALEAVRRESAVLTDELRSRLLSGAVVGLSPEAWEAHRTPAANRTAAQTKLVEQTTRDLDSHLDRVATPDERRERNRFAAALAALQEAGPGPLPRAYVWHEPPDQRTTTQVFRRGNPATPAGLVEPGFPQVLLRVAPAVTPQPRPADAGAPSVSPRLALATWLTDPRNPLVPRVAVNRLWQGHFREGLVATENDFGVMGSPPSHPGLLDYLALRLVESGQRFKPLHREIVLSDAYAQASDWNPAAAAIDGENRLLWRFPYHRLDAEALRDSVLAASGQLTWEMGGPGTHPRIHPDVLQGQSRPGSGWGAFRPDQAARRSVYVHVKRSLIIPELELLDFADTTSACEQRPVSTIPTQALTLLNGQFWNSQAALLADDIERQLVSRPVRLGEPAPTPPGPHGPAADEQRVIVAYARVLGREATPAERRSGAEFLINQRRLLADEAPIKPPAEIQREAVSALCLVLLNLNEFAYVD